MIGTGTTFLVAYFVTENAVVSGSIMGIDAIIKTIFYYLHERFWNLGGEL